MGIIVYSLQWVMQDFVHQQWCILKKEQGVTFLSAASKNSRVSGLELWL